MRFFNHLLAIIPLFLAASPASASAGIPLPEPSGLLLLGMGIAGVVVGRRFSSRKGRD